MAETFDPAALRAEMLALGWPPQMVDREVALQAKMIELLAANPDLNPITASIMAGDAVSVDWVYDDVKAGKIEAAHAPNLVGSYARCDFALRLRDEGLLSEADLLDNWPDYWRSGDPDDTDPRFLAVWKAARERNGRCVTDGRRLPAGKWLMAFRGQRRGDPIGLSWTLDREIAGKFATGAGVRVPLKDGGIKQSWVRRDAILAYVTGRGESELIVDPEYFKDAQWEAIDGPETEAAAG